ncbi:MAG: sigma-54-dependent Fis family transcriptional regulator [Byssovorax sp.]
MKERDFYRKLVALSAQDELGPFLADALGLIVEVAGARRGYIELSDGRDADGLPRFWLARGCSDEDVAAIRGSLSTGVIAEAIVTGKTIATASALTDPRFKARGSVRRNKIEAVLCAPIGASSLVGVVYLQDRIAVGPFSDEDREHVEAFARQLGPLADRLVMREARKEEDDPTRTLRTELNLSGVIGRSPALAKLLKGVKLVAPNDIAVLLVGPSGTGKTAVASVIHNNGPRAHGPFLALNCATLPENLAENELFGAARGGHGTATQPIEGKVAAASGGTLFLDEVGELPLGVQSKLLTFLESKEYQRLGSTKKERSDTRIIAATNADLRALIGENRFRADLFYRLQGMTLRVPALAERREDIGDLVRFFGERCCETYHLPAMRFSPGTLRAAEAAEWPGNIRELCSAVERATMTAAAEGALVVERTHLFPDEEEGGTKEARKTFQAATRDFQKKYVEEVLEATGWDLVKAAEWLDVSRSHLYNLIKAHGLGKKKE